MESAEIPQEVGEGRGANQDLAGGEGTELSSLSLSLGLEARQLWFWTTAAERIHCCCGVFCPSLPLLTVGKPLLTLLLSLFPPQN